MSGLDESRLVLTDQGAARTGDVLAFACEDEAWKVLLIERGGDPEKGSLALPGGFMERRIDERAGMTAARELEEETGLSVEPPPAEYDQGRMPTIEIGRLAWVDLYDDPGRDPRRWTSTDVYAVVLSERPEVEGADDAASAAFYGLDELLERIAVARASGGKVCAFDHDQAVLDAVEMLHSYGVL